MPENRNSFILFPDLLSTVEKLRDEQAGSLFKMILKYVNNIEFEIGDQLLEIAFEPIKQQLRRDKLRWDEHRKKQSENGKLGGRPLKNNQENPLLSPKSQKSLINNVNNNVINKEESLNNKQKDCIVRKEAFADSLKPFLNKYDKKLIREFYDYWTEDDKSKTKFRAEMEKTWNVAIRLSRWQKNDISGKKGTYHSSSEAIYVPPPRAINHDDRP